MRRIAFVVLLAVAVLLLVVASPNRAISQYSSPVRVTNTESQPVPVNGRVSIASLPAVQLAGVPAVQVNSLPPGPLSIKDSELPDRNMVVLRQNSWGPLEGLQSCDWVPDGAADFQVPAGKRVIFDHIAVQFSLIDTRVGEFVRIYTWTKNGRSNTGYVALQNVGPNQLVFGDPHHFWVADKDIQVVSDAGYRTEICLFQAGSGSSAGGAYTLSGRMVDCGDDCQ